VGSGAYQTASIAAGKMCAARASPALAHQQRALASQQCVDMMVNIATPSGRRTLLQLKLPSFNFTSLLFISSDV
jgi:hypothetical protein